MTPILISQRLMENAEYPERREGLDVRWGDFLMPCGFLPIPVALNVPLKEYFEILSPGGILLTGGNDLAIFQEGEMNRTRDRLETDLIDYAIRLEVPLIGICRGMQLVCHYFGCRLERIPGHFPEPHEVQLEAAASAFAMVYPPRFQANSFHQHGVLEAGPDLKIAARAGDQTIEAVEHKRNSIFGMMWHPERERPFRSEDLAFFQNVFLKRSPLAGKEKYL